VPVRLGEACVMRFVSGWFHDLGFELLSRGVYIEGATSLQRRLKIPMKKTIVAIIVGFIVQLAGLFLIHSVLLKQDYVNTASLWRSQEAMSARSWALLMGDLIYVVGAVLIYVRGVEAKPWIGQGVRFGILLALVTVVNGSLVSWAILTIPHMLAVKWIIYEGVLSVVFGLVIAAICQPKAVAA